MSFSGCFHQSCAQSGRAGSAWPSGNGSLSVISSNCAAVVNIWGGNCGTGGGPGGPGPRGGASRMLRFSILFVQTIGDYCVYGGIVIAVFRRMLDTLSGAMTKVGIDMARAHFDIQYLPSRPQALPDLRSFKPRRYMTWNCRTPSSPRASVQ